MYDKDGSNCIQWHEFGFNALQRSKSDELFINVPERWLKESMLTVLQSVPSSLVYSCLDSGEN